MHQELSKFTPSFIHSLLTKHPLCAKSCGQGGKEADSILTSPLMSLDGETDQGQFRQ